MTIRSIRVLSLAKVVGLIYAGLGLIFGLLFTLLTLLGVGPASQGDADPAFVGYLLGAGAVIVLPLLYGFFGCLIGAVVGTIYNLVARLVGGLELEVS